MNDIATAPSGLFAALSEFGSTGYSILPGAASLLVGFALGLAYFGGLWITVRGVIKHPNLAGLTLVSGVLRMTVVCFAFYFLSIRGAASVLAALAGMWIARWILVCRWGRCCHGS